MWEHLIFKNCCLSYQLEFQKKKYSIQKVLALDRDRISNSFSNDGKHVSTILYYVRMWSGVFSVVDFKTKMSVNPEKTPKIFYILQCQILIQDTTLYVIVNKTIHHSLVRKVVFIFSKWENHIYAKKFSKQMSLESIVNVVWLILFILYTTYIPTYPRLLSLLDKGEKFKKLYPQEYTYGSLPFCKWDREARSPFFNIMRFHVCTCM